MNARLRPFTRTTTSLLLGLCAAAALTCGLAAQNGSAEVVPGSAWATIDSAATTPSSAARFDALRAFLKTTPTTGLMAVVGGRVAFQYGDVARVSKVASVRKSVLAMLYGKHVAAGRVDLGQTVKQLGLDDLQPFLPEEEGATLLQLLTARSGIYLPAGNPELTALSPRRGSQSPGTYFQYQNWDFNAAGAAFEKLTGTRIFDAVETDLARPLGMQDFSVSRQKAISAMPDSRFPEYAMYFSTRDMARLGLLMLRGGSWNGAQLIPRAWCERITTLVTPHRDIHPTNLGSGAWASRWGYGMLWWVWDAPTLPGVITGPYSGAYTAMGAFGQYITVLPVLDMVIAHKLDFDEAEAQGRKVPEVQPYEFDAILQLLIAAHLGG